jgi:hypothetical protein
MDVTIHTSNEPEFLKQISNTSVCTWFYILFILNAVFAAAAILRTIYMSLILKINVGYKLFYLLLTTVTITIPLINATFFYIMCNRALPSSKNYL